MDSIYQKLATPLGEMLLVSQEEALTGLYFIVGRKRLVIPPTYIEDKDAAVLNETASQLTEYFEGKRKTFDLPIKLKGSAFQIRVWKELFNISYGETVSYLDIAKRIDNPGAVRAVGLANGKNPVSIIYPCHRVIGSNGKLTGYGGGIENKAWLLRHEQKYANKSYQTSLFDV